jgi:hypothetical protein
VRREHQYPTLAYIVALVADDLNLGVGNRPDWVAVVWVSIDQDYASYGQQQENESSERGEDRLTSSNFVDNSLVGLEEVRSVMDELAALAIT